MKELRCVQSPLNGRWILVDEKGDHYMDVVTQEEGLRFAASHDLLKACEAFVEGSEARERLAGTCTVGELRARERARAAIAKAKGQ